MSSNQLDSMISQLANSLNDQAKVIVDDVNLSDIEKLERLLKIRSVLRDSYEENDVNAAVSACLLDIEKVPKLIGDMPIKRARECVDIVTKTRVPLYMIGDSGTGKTATMQAIGAGVSKHMTAQLEKRYPQEKPKYPVYYFQLSREDTKTTVLLGYRLIKGSLKVVPGILAHAAMQKWGAIVLIDEITHTTHSMLTLLNAFDGANSTITIGDMAIDASKVKLLLGSNSSRLAGNIKIPPSSVNRWISMKFDHPSFDDEVIVSVDVANRNYIRSNDPNDKITVPASVCKFIAAIIREVREQYNWPLSTRNIAHGILLCQLAPVVKKDVNVHINKVDRHFTKLQNSEPQRVLIAKRIMQKKEDEVKDVSLLHDHEIISFIEFVSKISVNKFKEILLQAMNFDVDIEGLSSIDSTVRQKIQVGLL